MPETTIDSAHYPGLAKLGPLAGDLKYRAWVLPPGGSITALVMRELVGKDDLAAASRSQTSEEELLELCRQAVVAFSTAPVPMIAVRKMDPVRDRDGNVTGEVEVEVEEPDLDKADWQHVVGQPFPEFDNWKRSTRKILVVFYNELNGIDLGEVGKALASGREWSPTTQRTTTTGGRAQSQQRQPISSNTGGQKLGSSRGGSARPGTSTG